jgi:putative ATP-binding cassette transporter
MMAMVTKVGFLRQAWKLTWPYWKSEEKWSAVGLLVAVIVLNLITVGLNVRFNTWYNDFYDALQQYNWAQFWRQLVIFGIIAFLFIVVAVY